MVRYAKPALLDAVPASHCVIEASAGTGKTFTLEHLVVQLILDGVPLESILVVTFTRKATLELIARVREKLAELAGLAEDRVREGEPFWDLGPGDRERLKDALMGFDRATISTIHGFCQQVLKDASFEGGHLFQQEAVASDEAFDRAFTTVLRNTYATGRSALLSVALRTQGGTAGLRDLLKEALKEADCLDLPAFRDAGTFLADFPEDLARAFLAGTGTVRDGFPPRNLKAISSRIGEVLGRREQALGSGGPESFWLDQGWLEGTLLKGLEPICVDGLAGDAARLSVAMAGLANFKAILVAAFLPALRAELRRFKEAEGLYDFDDMITLVARALAGPQGEALAQRIRARYQVALIDEFQDTDRTQWEIFSRIFLDAPDGHRLFLVGDPKQAIYGFRSGDLPTYGAALEAIAARTGARPLQLTENFRSTPGVVQACNAIFEGGPDAPFFSEGNARHYHQPVTCGRKALRLTDAGGLPLPSIRTVDVPVGSARAVKVQAAAALARAIRGTLAAGRFNAPGRARPELGPEDVFVLTRTLREGKLMARALRAVGIPSALYRQDGLFDGPEAAACRDILLAIEAPLDECRRAKALLGPFFGLSFPEAERARDLPEGHPILARLFRWRDLALRGRFGELCNALVTESGMSRRLLFLEENQRTLTNLAHILELVQQRALGGHCTLADLAIQVQRWIDRKDRPSVEDGETQRLERQGGAVQILTMHKAKGLQAPVVALFGGTSGFGRGTVFRYHAGGSGERRAWVGPVKAAPAPVQGWIRQEEQEEAERLAYVALTRAEAQLVLPRYVPGPAPPDNRGQFDPAGNPKQGPYRPVNLRLRALLGSPDEPVAMDGVERIPAEAGTPGEAPPAPGPWTAVLPPPPVRPDFQDLARRGRPVWVFNFSRLQEGLAQTGAEGSDEVKERAPAGGPAGGRKFGVQVHACLQRVDLKSFAGLDLEAWLALPATAALADACQLHEGRKDALRWIHQAMTLPMPLAGGGAAVLCQSEELLRELDFLTPYPGRRDFLNGSIDLLFQWQGRTHVLDWKTNRLAGYGPAELEAAVRDHYLLQVKIYTVTACRFLGIEDAGHYERAFGGVVYVFLRGLPEAGTWTCRPSWDELREWERDLDALRPEQLIPDHAGGERHV